MRDLRSDAVRDRGADRAAGSPHRAEHEVVDEELRPAVEEIRERLRAVHRLEAVVLHDLDPRKLLPLLGQLITAVGELLLLGEQRLALGLPLLLAYNPVLSH